LVEVVFGVGVVDFVGEGVVAFGAGGGGHCGRGYVGCLFEDMLWLLRKMMFLIRELVPMLHASPHVYFFGSPCYLILSVT
jgi:hypothetical protein